MRPDSPVTTRWPSISAGHTGAAWRVAAGLRTAPSEQPNSSRNASQRRTGPSGRKSGAKRKEDV